MKDKSKQNAAASNGGGLYRPVILKYKCYGGIHFQQPPESSKPATSGPKLDDLASTAPTCHGIETELERMYEFEPMSAPKAVMNFAQYTSTTVAGSAEAWEARRHRMEKGFGGAIFDSKKEAKNGQSNKDMDKEDMRKLFPFVIDHRAIDYDSVDGETDTHTSSNNTLDRLREAARKNIESLNDGNTAASSKPEPTLWTTASFYGKTDITVLVLFPYLNPYKQESSSKREDTNRGSPTKADEQLESSATLAALAPELKLGLAVRQAGDKKYPGIVDELNTARIGPVEISIGSRIEENEEDIEETDSNEHRHRNDISSQHRDTNGRKGISLEDVSQSMRDAAQKTASRMVTNFNLIRDELSDDFIPRTMSSGEKVLDSCGKSLERMQKLISDTYDHWIHSDNSRRR